MWGKSFMREYTIQKFWETARSKSVRTVSDIGGSMLRPWFYCSEIWLPDCSPYMSGSMLRSWSYCRKIWFNSGCSGSMSLWLTTKVWSRLLKLYQHVCGSTHKLHLVKFLSHSGDFFCDFQTFMRILWGILSHHEKPKDMNTTFNNRIWHSKVVFISACFSLRLTMFFKKT